MKRRRLLRFSSAMREAPWWPQLPTKSDGSLTPVGRLGRAILLLGFAGPRCLLCAIRCTLSGPPRTELSISG